MVDKNLPVQMHCFDLQIKITQYVEMKLNKIDVSFWLLFLKLIKIIFQIN